MGNIPLPVKIILNSLLAFVYFFFVFFGGSFLGGVIIGVIGKEDIESMYIVKIAAVIAVTCMMFTVTYRKQFYIMKQVPVEVEADKTNQS